MNYNRLEELTGDFKSFVANVYHRAGLHIDASDIANVTPAADLLGLSDITDMFQLFKYGASFEIYREYCSNRAIRELEDYFDANVLHTPILKFADGVLLVSGWSIMLVRRTCR